MRQERNRETRVRFEVSDVYLLSKKIGLLEVQVPEYSGATCQAAFSLLSPDTVEFTKEERELYSLLGAKVRVEATWKPASASVRTVPRGASGEQEVAPRDKVTWSWTFDGPADAPERVTLVAFLKDKDNEVISLGSRDFWVAPAGTMAWIKSQFAPLSVVLGVVLGVAILGLFIGLRGGRARTGGGSKSPAREYVAEKRL